MTEPVRYYHATNSGSDRPRVRRPNVASLRLGVAHFKAIADLVSLDVRPLTVIAGVNSSGKSSFMQPFLLLKQTIDASFSAGPLLLHGPNVRMTRWDQAINRGKGRTSSAEGFSFSISEGNNAISNQYRWNSGGTVDLKSTRYDRNGHSEVIDRGMSREELSRVGEWLDELEILEMLREPDESSVKFEIEERRGFLAPGARIERGSNSKSSFVYPLSDWSNQMATRIATMIHVPGLRGNPERSYYASSTGSNLAGTIEPYVASLLNSWRSGNASEKRKLRGVADDLSAMGLTWKVTVRRLNDVQLELLVGRMPRAQQGGANDLVNIADVGFGVSQVLPVLVALWAARKDQIVYIEQPEIHLHPRAQTKVTEALVRAAQRGVRVIVETHSSLVIRRIQTAIARSEIHQSDVSLNWFSRAEETGDSIVHEAALDSDGRFGDWPIDFDEVAEEADWDYLMAASSE